MDLKSVHTIFKDNLLRIPSYQRGYSWSNNKKVNPSLTFPLKDIQGQLVDLWEDITNIPFGKWHYTGLLTLVKIKEKEYNWLSTHTQFAIVDGQQRITSILILLSVIIEKSNSIKHTLGIRDGDVEFQYLFIEKSNLKAYIFGYEKDNPSDKYFRKHILRLDEIEDDSEESIYTENLKNARIFFEDMINHSTEVSEDDEATTLQRLFDTVTNDLRFNEYILPEELDEYVVFETMNNRGKPLSQLEKLKNRLMYLNDKFEVSDSQNEDLSEEDLTKIKVAQQNELGNSINKAWITIYQSLGKNKKTPLNDEEFVKNHWITFFGNYSRQEANVYANFLFNEHFHLQKVYNKKLTRNDTEIYVKSLQTSSKWWNKLNHPQYFTNEEKELKGAILNLKRAGISPSFKPLILAILTRHDRLDFIPVINLLEKYNFKVFDVTNRKANTGDSKLYSLAHEIYNRSINRYSLIEEINTITNHYYRFTSFINRVEELFDTGKGYYDWSGKKYFLFIYDQYLREINSTSTIASELQWEDFVNKKSIEHILPQSACLSIEEYRTEKNGNKISIKESYEKIQNDWSSFKDFTPFERKSLANSLGNLLAISSSDNSSFSNDPFEYKIDQSNKGENYKNRGYKFDSLSAMIVVSENTEWTPVSILKRGLEMLNFLCEYIGEDFSEINKLDKYKLLGLEFMYEKEQENTQITVANNV